jgi:hypothetical protein
MRISPLEADIQKAIIQAFALVHRIHLIPIDAGAAGMRSNLSKVHAHSNIPEGFPDLLGIIPGSGRTLMIEVKRPGAKPRANQLAFLAWGCEQGAVTFWADSVDSALRQFEEQTRRTA